MFHHGGLKGHDSAEKVNHLSPSLGLPCRWMPQNPQNGRHTIKQPLPHSFQGPQLNQSQFNPRDLTGLRTSRPGVGWARSEAHLVAFAVHLQALGPPTVAALACALECLQQRHGVKLSNAFRVYTLLCYSQHCAERPWECNPLTCSMLLGTHAWKPFGTWLV
jgi:hypothetical protein